MLIPNSIGDGIVRVAIYDKNDAQNFNECMMNYIASVKGEFYIYDYDCADNTDAAARVKKLNGRYSVYTYEGLIALIEK